MIQEKVDGNLAGSWRAYSVLRLICGKARTPNVHRFMGDRMFQAPLTE